MKRMLSFALSTLLLNSLLATAFFESVVSAKDEDAAVYPGAGKVVKVQEGFQFTEGPAYDGKAYLYFTDIPNNRIMRTDLRGGLEIFLEPSGRCNGLMIDGEGKLIACRMDGELISIDTKSKEITVLSARYQDAPFNACNDLVIDSRGGIYFTDPRYGSAEPWPQGKEAFYYRNPQGEVTRLGDEIIAPNGIILSVDEKTLYVLPSMQKQVMAYEVKSPGVLGTGRVLYEIQQPQGKESSGGDGLALDVKGNLYLTTDLGVQIVSPKGKLLGIIEFPEIPANCKFGGPDNKTLYATCRTGLYSVTLPDAGHIFPGIVPLPAAEGKE